MDPLTLLVTALTTGATLMLKSAVGEAAKDAYKALRDRVLKKYGDKNDVPMAVKAIESDPASASRQGLLREELAKTQAVNDQELLKAAQALLEAAKTADPQQAQQSVSIVGDDNEVNQVYQQAGDNAFQVGIARDVNKSK